MRPQRLTKILRDAAAYSLSPEIEDTDSPITALAWAAGDSYPRATNFLYETELGWPCWPAGNREANALTFCLAAELLKDGVASEQFK